MKGLKIFTVVVVIVLLTITSWYFLGRETIKTEDDYNGSTIVGLNFTVEEYPKVDGSTSTHPLDVIIACRLLNISYYETIWYDGTRRIVPNASEPGKEYIAENITANIIHHGTHDAYVNLINGTTDLVLVARLPSEDELAFAGEKSVELEAKPIALDAFVFILNEKNPIDNLTIEQIQGIYTGAITNWTEVGGNYTDINPYQRDENSGSQELMKTLVMKELEMIDAPDMILYGMMGPINRLSWDENGIGYTVYFFEEFMAPNDHVKLIGVNGYYPDYENIKTRKYPITTEVYVVIRKDLDKDNNAYKLRDWLLSEEGQSVIEESGYVPIK